MSEEQDPLLAGLGETPVDSGAQQQQEQQPEQPQEAEEHREEEPPRLDPEQEAHNKASFEPV